MIIYKAPAKLNFFLDILSNREDGYHNIVTLMVKVSLYDIVKISKSERKGIFLKILGEAPEGEENICYQTAKLMQERFYLDSGIKIELKKNIPLESGLGGASSDAGCVIKGLNKIFKLGLKETEKIELALLLGTDVPFFVIDCIWAVATERGESLRKITPNLKFYALLVLPNFRIKTKDAYCKWTASLTSKSSWTKIKNCSSEEINFNFLKEYSYNVFEKILNREEIITLKAKLASLGAEVVGLTGSGPTVYGMFSKRKEAIEGRERLISFGYQVYLVEPLKEGGAYFGDYRD